MSFKPMERFSNRVEDYVRYRPSYPRECILRLCERCGWRPGSYLADVGSGTGLLTRLLIDEGLRVTGIEPNAEMRAAGERFLEHESGFTSIAASAEKTGLETESVDGITVAPVSFSRMVVGTSRFGGGLSPRPSTDWRSPAVKRSACTAGRTPSVFGAYAASRARSGAAWKKRRIFLRNSSAVDVSKVGGVARQHLSCS